MPKHTTQPIIFQQKEIRRKWYKQEWYFAIIDIVELLSESSDPRQYIKKMRQRDPMLKMNWGTICTPLQMKAEDGKQRKISCSNTKGIFRIIQSIPSKKAEPFKQWLAKVGKERI